MARLHPRDLRQRFTGLPVILRLIVPVLLGLVMALGHEDWIGGFFPVMVGLVLACLMMPDTRKGAGRFGWLFGFGYFAVTLRWIVEPFLVDVPRHGWMAPFAIILMAGGLALFWALAFRIARFIAGPRDHVVLWLPVTLAAAELARGHVFTGFPWGLPSYALIGGVGDVWFAWVGAYGATLLLAGVAGATAYCLIRGWTLIWPGLVGVFIVTIGLQAVTPAAPAPLSNTVRLVQPNAPQHLKWAPGWRDEFFNRALAQTAAGDPVDVVIWPETSVPALLATAGAQIERMSLSARGAPVVAGILRRDQAGIYNSAILVDGPSTVAAISDKAHLVPFGEYVPLAWLLEPLGLGTLVDQVGGFSAGAGDGLMEVDGLGLARVLICYEGIFPNEIKRGDVRPDILMILTNDAWFGNNAGPRQHLTQARARAIEQGLPVVRAANTGISAVIDARGRIVDSLPLNEAGYLDAPVPAALPPTLYARTSDWPIVAVLVVVLGAGVARRNRFVVDQIARPS